MHRDVKWANRVTSRGAVRLVDWEMAGWGDPALDIGAALGEFLGHGLRRGRHAASAPADAAVAAGWAPGLLGGHAGIGPLSLRLHDRGVPSPLLIGAPIS